MGHYFLLIYPSIQVYSHPFPSPPSPPTLLTLLVIFSESDTLSADAAVAHNNEYTWQEVAKHNTGDSAWVIVKNEVYDITSFLDRHPGGREMLLLSAGRECTDLFTMYHWWDDGTKARAVMEKLRVGTFTGESEFPTYPPDSRGFYKEVSKRVRGYFVSTKQDPKAPWAGLWRLAIILSVAFTAYAIVNNQLFPGSPLALRVAAAVTLGIFQAMPLMHAMHDASHAAIGHSEGMWIGVGRLCLDWFAGGSMITWHHQHIIGHHVYTNVYKGDPDLPCS